MFNLSKSITTQTPVSFFTASYVQKRYFQLHRSKIPTKFTKSFDHIPLGFGLDGPHDPPNPSWNDDFVPIQEQPLFTSPSLSGAGIKSCAINRPHQRNSLNYDMVVYLEGLIRKWDARDEVKKGMIVRGRTNDFSVGYDMLSYSKDMKKYVDEFLPKSYQLNYTAATTHLPLLVLQDGYVLGGAATFAMNCSLKICTSNTTWALPETSLGLFPDGGASYHLARIKNPGLGMFLGLTGKRLKNSDLMHIGFGEHVIETEDFHRMEHVVAKDSWFRKSDYSSFFTRMSEFISLSGFHFTMGAELGHIRECFTKDTIEEVYEALEKNGNAFCMAALNKLKSSSQVSVRATFNLIKKAETMSLYETMLMEYRVAQNLVNEYPDFQEGITALMVEKREPKWFHKNLEDFPQSEIEPWFDQRSDIKELQIEALPDVEKRNLWKLDREQWEQEWTGTYGDVTPEEEQKLDKQILARDDVILDLTTFEENIKHLQQSNDRDPNENGAITELVKAQINVERVLQWGSNQKMQFDPKTRDDIPPFPGNKRLLFNMEEIFDDVNVKGDIIEPKDRDDPDNPSTYLHHLIPRDDRDREYAPEEHWWGQPHLDIKEGEYTFRRLNDDESDEDPDVELIDNRVDKLEPDRRIDGNGNVCEDFEADDEIERRLQRIEERKQLQKDGDFGNTIDISKFQTDVKEQTYNNADLPETNLDEDIFNPDGTYKYSEPIEEEIQDIDETEFTQKVENESITLKELKKILADPYAVDEVATSMGYPSDIEHGWEWTWREIEMASLSMERSDLG